MKKRIVAWLLIACLTASAMPVMAFAADTGSEQCEHIWGEGDCTAPRTCTVCGETEEEASGHIFDSAAAQDCVDQVCTVCMETIPGSANHKVVKHEAQEPSYTDNGWEAYETCENCDYSTFKAIPKLEPEIDSYEDFVKYLAELEELAVQYAKLNPGKDPIALVIKYIRTGVDRYNSGSWGIMAGYEDSEFATYVQRNATPLTASNHMNVTALKNINEFELPNGDWVDFGHMFGTMDISYHNKGSQNHADVGGWAGDLVDLMTSADRAYGKHEDSTVYMDLPEDYDLETMVGQIGEKIFLQVTCPDDKFNQTDFYGDIDGMYAINSLYDIDEYAAGDMAEIFEEYCTESLDDEARAAYFMNERLGNSGTRAQVRAIVYEEFSSNKTVTTLESTRAWLNSDNTYLQQLRKAACYAFADYVCLLAGDYVENVDNPYYTDFSSEISQLAPGVTQEIRKANSVDGKQMVYYLATADLSNPYVTVNANYANNDPSKWAPARVLDQANAAQENRGNPDSDAYVPNYQIVAAINADGFSMESGVPSGVLVMDGHEWNPINSHGFFGITKDGEAVIGTTAEYNTIYKDKIRDAVSGFGTTLVKDGKVNITASSDYYNNRASRTAVGITKTGKVVFMVLDGRQEPVSCGGSMVEIAQIMMEAGCVDAINLDGGGSTTFVSKPEGQDELQVTNNPSDGYARNVSSSLIIVSTAPSSTAFDHAIIESKYSYATTDTEVQLTAVGVSATGNVAEMPEGYTWAVSDEMMGSVTEDGVFTGLRNGSVDVYLMLDDEIVGTKTMNMVMPDSVYFTRKTMNAVYNSSVTLPVAALFEGKPVAISESDVTLTVGLEEAGSCDGFEFYAEESEIKNVLITAKLKLNPDIAGTITVNLYKQGENTFDFDKADGGDQQLAWVREVSNSAFDGEMSYSAIDRSKDMEVSYIFAVDMSQITMPDKLTDLIYMLPGADDPNASAWNFLLQLAERISVLTKVTATVKVDPRFDVDISELKVINEYFYLDEDGIDLNEETNEVTLTLKWKDQTQAIDAATANPLCILNGIKLIPKDGIYDETDTINVISSGRVGYEVYLRTSTLYSFCQKPENQEKYGLLPFQSTYHDGDGILKPENGGYFVNDNYKTFNDYFNLSYAMKQGWVKESGGWAYYVDDEPLTGIQQIKDFFYDFGEDGLNVGQKKYNGIYIDEEGGEHYVSVGKIQTSGWAKDGDVGYHCHSDGYIHEATIQDPTTCIKGGVIRYTCLDCGVQEKVGDFVFPTGHDWDEDYVCQICGHEGRDVADLAKSFDNNYAYYFYNGTGGLKLSFKVKDGDYVLTWSNDATLLTEKDGISPSDPRYNTMRDMYVSWENAKGIGLVVMSITGRGDYYGSTTMTYPVVPLAVQKLTAKTVGADAVLLNWTPGNPGSGKKGDGADAYRVYVDGVEVADVSGAGYVVADLAPGEHTFKVVAHAASTNQSENGKDYVSSTKNLVTASASVVANLRTPEIYEDEITVEFKGEPVVDGSWQVIVVTYGEHGEMLSVATQTVTGKSLDVALEGIQTAHRVDVYVVDGEDSTPLITPAVFFNEIAE